MKVFQVSEQRFLLRLETGEEAMEKLRSFADEQKVNAGVLRGLGAVRSAELAFYHLAGKRYEPFPVEEQTEVAGLVGNLSRGEDGQPIAHVHVILSRRNGSTVGGHAMRLIVGATLELDVEVLPGTLRRKLEPAVGLPLQHSYE